MKNSESFDKTLYHKILCKGYPDFLDRYTKIEPLQRLAGVGLLCGTDWTPLYNNRYFYSRLDHSIGVALILWNFTHDKKQTIAGLLHDVSTPAFSHVSDFRNGDVLKQESTEEENKNIIHSCSELHNLLKEDGIELCDIDDYHRYSIADNEIPRLSADRLEYMFPSGIILNGSFDIESTSRLYKDICLCYNELDVPELAFESLDCAVEYCRRFCNTGLVLQHNENKISLQLLADILSLAFELNFLCEKDLFIKSEKQLIDYFDSICNCQVAKENQSSFKSISKKENYKKFCQYYKTFRTMKKIIRSDNPLEGFYNVSLNVKKRYINPLVIEFEKNSGFKNNTKPVCRGKRVTELSSEARKIVDDFLGFSDSLFGCVKLVDN